MVLCGVVSLLAACPGDRVPVLRADRGIAFPDVGGGKDHALPKDHGADTLASDTGASQPDVNPGSCSPTGTPTSCDPVAGTGCAAGACYLLSGKGFACVCPVGSTPVGAACNTTAECAPGFGCMGTTPPGSCRRFCTAVNNTCGANETCKAITTVLEMGLCAPNN